MKYILILFFALTTILSFAQQGSVNVGAIRSRVTDSTTVTTPAGYGVMYFNVQSSKWRCYNGTGWTDCGSGGGGGGGSVISVSGTTNRITSTGGTTPVIDISSSYVGQSSITTLGTIGTGVWNGTAIGSSYGGVPSGGSTDQILSKVNGTSYNTQWVNPPTLNPSGIPARIPYTSGSSTAFSYDNALVYDDVTKSISTPLVDLYAAGYTTSDPVSIGEGRIWYNATTHKFRLNENGTYKDWIGGGGTVTSVGVTTANGISATPTPITTSGNFTFSLGAITPTSVNGVVLSGSSTPTLAVTGTSAISGTHSGTSSGTNTGDQTTVTGNAGTATALSTPRTIGIVTGEATSAGSSFDGTGNNTNALTLSNSAVIAKTLTGYAAASGTVSSADNILLAIGKLDGNIQALGTTLPALGTIFTNDFSSGSLTGYTTTGTGTYSVSSGRLQVSGGAGAIGDGIRYDTYGISNLETNRFVTTLYPSTIGATLSYYQFSLMSQAGTAVDNIFRIYLSTSTTVNATSDLGRITGTTRVNAAIQTAGVETSQAGLAITSGDVLTLTALMVKNNWLITLKNETTGLSNLFLYQQPSSSTFGGNVRGIPGAFKPQWTILNANGANHQIDNLDWYSYDFKNTTVQVVCDSKGKLATSSNMDNRWPDYIGKICDATVQVNGAAGAVFDDNRVAENLSLTPQIFVIDLGVNDLSTGSTPAQVMTKLTTYVNALVSAGYLVGTNIFINSLSPYSPENTDILAYNALVFASYPTAYIDQYSWAISGTAYNTKYSIDGIHPNDEGQKRMAAQVIQKLNLTFKTKRNFDEAIVRKDITNGNVMVTNSDASSLTPLTYDQLSAVRIGSNSGADVGSLWVNTDSYSLLPNGGIRMWSHGGSTGVISAGSRPGTSTANMIPVTSTSTSITQNAGVFRFNINTGLTAGTPYTPSVFAFMNSTGFTVGGNVAPVGLLTLAQPALSSGWTPALTLTAGAHTVRTSGTAFPDALLNFARTSQHATGAITAVQANLEIRPSTETFAGTSAMTHQPTVYIKGAPIAGTANNAALTGGLFIESASVQSGTGTATRSYGAYVQAMSGATTNDAAYFTGGNVGIGTTSPSAKLHVAAGTATASTSPLKYTTGTLLSTIEAGANEYLTNGYYKSNEALNRLAIGGTIADFVSDVSNTGTGETDIYTYTTKASTLISTGEKLFFDYTLTLSDITATAQIKVVFAGTTIGDTGALTVSATGAVVVKGYIIRTGASTARASVNISSPTASTAVYTAETDLTGLTFTNTNILKVTGTAGGAGGGTGDITGKLGTISFHPAAAN